jgi:DNA invertase Pin-like site-specific DNA recombinase
MSVQVCMFVNMKAIAYYRVSTAQQGLSGLGLEAQQASVSAFCDSRYEIIESYTDIESGKRANRPQLNLALEACKKYKAKLVIAKLDRLSRDLHFITTVMKNKIDFVCVDNPHANKMTIQILGVMAEYEREQISLRTKAALQAAKARGVRLGTTGQALADRNRLMAKEEAIRLVPVITKLRDSGICTIKGLAEAMGKHPTQVQRILSRLK